MLIVVEGDYNTFTFPGARWVINTISRVGGDFTKSEVIGIKHEDFQTVLETTAQTVVLCLDRVAFSRVSGIEGRIISTRGYLYSPSDCVPTKNKVTRQVGVYKTTRKKDGEIIHEKGSPRYGKVEVLSRTKLSQYIKWIIPTFDMDYVRTTGFAAGVAVRADISRAIRFEDTTAMPLSINNLSIEIGPTLDEALSLDIETVGYTRTICQIGLATSKATVSSMWNAFSKHMTQLAVNDAQVIVGHNLSFDIPRLEEAGISFAGKPRFDTMLAAVLLNPDLHKGLERTATLLLDLRPWKHLAKDDLTRYNASDAFVTYHLGVQQVATLKNIGMYDLFTKTIMPSTSVLISMTAKGIKVDVDYLFKWQQALRIRLQNTSILWNQLAPGVSPLSPAQLNRHFYYTLNLTKQYTKRKKGKSSLSTDEAALKTLIRLHPDHTDAINALLEFKKCQKLLSTYATIAISEDGCIHPSYLPSQSAELSGYTSTGRIASTDPNIQNQTPESKRLFIPHDPGMMFLEFDFSQIELRIAAALSNDAALITALKGDVHATTMALVGCDRVRAKNLIYGSLYGAGPRKLATILKTRGVPTTASECAALQRALASAYPGLWAWRTAVATEGLANKFLVNSFGRRRYFFSSENSIPEMYDFLPQSNAADILWSTLIPLNNIANTLGGNFLTTTHDSGLFEFEESKIPQAASKIREVCEQEWPQIAPGFKVPVNFKCGTNWGEMKELP